MDWPVAFKFLHIGTMFTAVGVSLGTELMAHRVARTGDVHGIRTFFEQARAVGRIIPILFLAGLAFGLIAAWAGAFNFFAPWLLLAYVVFATLLALQSTIGAGWFRRVTALAQAQPDGAPSDELGAVLHDRTSGMLLWVTVAAVILIVFIMVVKPLS